MIENRYGILSGTIISNNGIIVPGAQVNVNFTNGGASAQLYSDREGLVPILNPIYTDSAGRYECYVKQDNYNVTVSGPGITTYTINDNPVTSELRQSNFNILILNGYGGYISVNVVGYVFSVYGNITGQVAAGTIIASMPFSPKNSIIVIGADLINNKAVYLDITASGNITLNYNIPVGNSVLFSYTGIRSVD